MAWGWYAGFLLLAAADWLAVGLNRPRWRIFTKPGTMLVLILGFTLSSAWQREAGWFGMGLVFSLLGDVLLMLPPSFFAAGVGAFLVAHLAYIIGLNQSFVIPNWLFVFPLLILALADTLGYRHLRNAIKTRPKGRWIRFPMMVYIIVISLMLFSSLLTWLRPDWPAQAAALVSIGALLFYLSDLILAFNRFCAPIRRGRVTVIVTYHLAQLAIVSGVLLKIGLLPH